MATVTYKTSGVAPIAEVCLAPGNKLHLIPNVPNQVEDDLARQIPEGIAGLAVTFSDGGTLGQTADAVVAQLVQEPVYTADQQAAEKEAAAAAEAVAVAKASSAQRATKPAGL